MKYHWCVEGDGSVLAMLECREGSSDMKYDVTYAVEQLAVDLAGNDEVEIKAVVAFRSFMRKAEKYRW